MFIVYGLAKLGDVSVRYRRDNSQTSIIEFAYKRENPSGSSYN